MSYSDEEKKKPENQRIGDNVTKIIVAIIGAIGVIVAAIITFFAPVTPQGQTFFQVIVSNNSESTGIAVVQTGEVTEEILPTNTSTDTPTSTNTSTSIETSTHTPIAGLVDTAVAQTLVALTPSETNEPISSPTSVIEVTVTNEIELVDNQRNNSAETVTYSFDLSNDEFVVAEAFFLEVVGFPETHDRGCMTFLAIGETSFDLNIQMGQWFLYRGMAGRDQAEGYLNERIEYVESLPDCGSVNMKTVRFPTDTTSGQSLIDAPPACLPAGCELGIIVPDGQTFQPQPSKPDTFNWYIVQTTNSADEYVFFIAPISHDFVCESNIPCVFFGYINGQTNALSEATRVCESNPACNSDVVIIEPDE